MHMFSGREREQKLTDILHFETYCIMANLLKYNIKINTCILQRSFLLWCMLYFFSATVSGKNDLRPLSDYLNHIINNKEQFSEIKEQRINNLENLLNRKGSSSEYYYEINRKLYNEYKKYKLDSAIQYATQNTGIARELNNQYFLYMSNIDLASVYSYSGKFLESEEILHSIDSQQLPNDLLEEYYEAYSRFYDLRYDRPTYGAIVLFGTRCNFSIIIYTDFFIKFFPRNRRVFIIPYF